MAGRGQKLVLLMIVAALFVVPLLCAIPVKANPLTTVTLALQEDPPEADVSPGSTGIVSLYGEVTCEKYGPDLVNVFLEVNSTHGGASVVPPSFVFSGTSGTEETESFFVTTKVSQGTSSSETVTVTVGGYYDQGGMRYIIEPVESLIIVKQYYLVEVSSNKVFNQTVITDEDVEFASIIHNTGNGHDIFLIDFENREEIEDEGFKLPDPIEVPIPEKGDENVGLKIGIPEDKTGDFHLKLSVTSKGSQGTDYPVKIVKHIYLEVREKSLAEHIGSIILSPLVIAVIVIVIVVGIVIRLRR